MLYQYINKYYKKYIRTDVLSNYNKGLCWNTWETSLKKIYITIITIFSLLLIYNINIKCVLILITAKEVIDT